MRPIAAVGDVLRGKYCLLAQIGKGGEGVVYLARDKELKKQWCVKVAETSPGLRLQCRLAHKRLPEVVDYWEEEGKAVIVMAYIAGCSLEEVLRQGQLSRKKALLWSRELLQVMIYLQQQKPPLVHGDLKPENLQISEEGELYLLDMGSLGPPLPDLPRNQKGTRGYAAPEQERGCCRLESDVYAMGKLLERMWRQAGGSRRLFWVLRKCQRKDPKRRYADSKALGEALEVCFAKMEQQTAPWQLSLLVLGLGVMFFAGVSLHGGTGRRAELVGMTAAVGREGGSTKEESVRQLKELVYAYYQTEKGTKQQTQYYERAMALGKVLEQAETAEGENCRWLLWLAQLCETEGEGAEAAFYYETYRKRQPEDGDGAALYGLWLWKEGRLEESRILWKKGMTGKSKWEGPNVRLWEARLKGGEKADGN